MITKVNKNNNNKIKNNTTVEKYANVEKCF